MSMHILKYIKTIFFGDYIYSIEDIKFYREQQHNFINRMSQKEYEHLCDWYANVLEPKLFSKIGGEISLNSLRILWFYLMFV